MAGPVQILVVDDEEPIRNALKKFLTQQQYEVYAAGSGDEALQQLRRHRIALMLCDIRMPATSGVDLLPQTIEPEPEPATLMHTAANDATSAASPTSPPRSPTSSESRKKTSSTCGSRAGCTTSARSGHANRS